MRSAADVSAVADPQTGVAVYDSGAPIGGWAIFGGTSASSPIIAAFDALIGPSAASAQWAYQHTNAFNDVTTGSNNLAGSGCSDYECNAGPGYDGPTGLGTPNGQAIAPPCSAGPVIATNPSNQTVTAPAGASFTAAASNPTGCNTLSVQWQVSTNGGSSWSNDSTDSGNTTNTLSISPTSTSQSGNEYRAVFTNEHGSTNTTAATLTVNSSCQTSPTITANPSNQTVTAPSQAQFTASASNSDPNCHTLSVQWQVSMNGGVNWQNDTTDAGNTTATLTISPTQTSQSGYEYRAAFSDEHGTTNTSAATLTVNAPCTGNPTITTNPSNQTAMAPSQAQFIAAATNNDPNCHALSVQWQVSTNGVSWQNDTTDAGNTAATLTISPTQTSESGYQYRAAFINEHGSTNSNAATLTVNSPPCSANPTIATNPSEQTVTAPSQAQFTAAATNSDSNCHALNVQWQVSTNGGESWQNDTSDAGTTTGTLTISPTSTTESGNEYHAVFSNEHGSTDTNAAKLTVVAPCSAHPTITTQPSSQTVIAPAAASFTAGAQNDDPNCQRLTVQWQVSVNGSQSWQDDTSDTGNTTGTLTISPTQTSESGNQYRAVFTNEKGSTSTNAATLTVGAPPPPCSANPTITTQPSSQTVIAPGAASFTAGAQNDDLNCQHLTVRWQVSVNGGQSWRNDTSDAGNETGTLGISPAQTSESGNEYRAVFSNEYGQTSSNTATLTVNAPALAPSLPSATALPHVSGAALVGATLSVSDGAWTGSPDTYQYSWFDCPTAAGGCAQVGSGSPSYTAGIGDLNGHLYAEIRAHNSAGWSPFVRSDDTIVPQSGRPLGGGHSGRIVLGRVRINGTSANVPLQLPRQHRLRSNTQPDRHGDVQARETDRGGRRRGEGSGPHQQGARARPRGGDA